MPQNRLHPIPAAAVAETDISCQTRFSLIAEGNLCPRTQLGRGHRTIKTATERPDRLAMSANVDMPEQ